MEERLMRLHLLATVVAALVMAAAEAKDEAVKAEWTKLAGTWSLTKMEANGKSLLKKEERPPRLVIKEGNILSKVGPVKDADLPVPLLDPTRKPKWFTIPDCKGGDPSKDVTAIGIYELKGDVLHLCVQVVENARLKERAQERPKAFDSKQGLLLVFKRF